MSRSGVFIAVLGCALALPVFGQQTQVGVFDGDTPQPGTSTPSTGTSNAAGVRTGTLVKSGVKQDAYRLGPQDTVSIRVLDMEELGTAPYPIDLRGDVTLPMVGAVPAAGLTVDELQRELTEKFRKYLQNPIVMVTVAEFHSQPVSVLGAVDKPGVHQIEGNKSLFEVISEAGGLRQDAGNTIKITRRMDYGPLPIPGASADASGRFSIGQISIRSVMQAKDPSENIPIKPHDVITVPKADLIYVIGSVKRPGGFPLEEKSNLSVLEALSLAEGLDKTASPGRAKILRDDGSGTSRVEIPVNVKRIMSGKNNDVPLLANDILFIPNSTEKVAAARAVEALIQTGTGVLIYAHPF